MPSRFAVACALAAAAFAPVVSAQTYNQTYVEGLVKGLNALNLTSLTKVLTTISGTDQGKALFAKIASGPYTLLAPDNDAFVGVAPIFANDPVWLTQAIAYHTLTGSFGVDAIANAPNATIKTTLLTDTNVVKLGPNGTPQNIGLRKYTNNGTTTAFVSHQDYPSFIRYSTGYQNLYIHVVSAVVDLPPQLNDFLTLPNYGENANVKTVTQLLKSTPNATALTQLQDVTVFLPSDSALAAAVQKFGAAALGNATLVTAILKDHVIQGNTIFIGGNQSTWTTAGGNSLTIGNGGSGVTKSVVYFQGYGVANIIEPDIILQNGVAHIIDAVLLNAKTTPTTSRKRNSRIYGAIAQ